MNIKTYIRFINKYVLLLLVAAFVFAGCKKEKIEEEGDPVLQKGNPININIEAHFAQPDNLQKAFLRGDSVEWEDGDEIRINNHNFTIESHNGGVGQFRGEAETFTTTVNGSTKYHWLAVYPASLANQTEMIMDGNKAQICVTIPQTQYYQAVNESNANTCLKDMNYMIAYTTTTENSKSISLQFVNLCAVLKIGLKKGDHDGHLVHNNSDDNSSVKK